MDVIGAGVGRTGTYSLKLAIERLGLGPCHHMEEVWDHRDTQVPLWSAAINGDADWATIYDGYRSAVDWPTARYFRELHAAHPDARFILTHRDPQRWADSFGATIYTVIAGRAEAPVEMRDWLEMVHGVVTATGFEDGLDHDELVAAFVAHNEAVKETVPGERLLVYEVKQGWGPLCEFLGVPVPDEPFPRTNDRAEFLAAIEAAREETR